MRSVLTTVCVLLVMIVVTTDGNPLEPGARKIRSTEHYLRGDCFKEELWKDEYPYMIPQTTPDNGNHELLKDTGATSESIDWTSSLPPAKDQGPICGSCWAFAAVGAIEKQFKGPLSEQCLVDCSKENKGCAGGHPKLAFDFVKKNGIAAEDTYPYTEKNETCKNYTAVTTIKGYYTINTDDELKHAVATVGPVAVGIQADDNFDQQVTDGIVENCTGPINHAVLVVGYMTINNTKVWKIRNSWGEDWGNNGYFYLTREVENACYVSRYAAVPIVSNNSTEATTAATGAACGPNLGGSSKWLLFLGFVAIVLK